MWTLLNVCSMNVLQNTYIHCAKNDFCDTPSIIQFFLMFASLSLACAHLFILKSTRLGLIRSQQIGAETGGGEFDVGHLCEHLVRARTACALGTEDNAVSPAQIAKRRPLRQRPALQNRTLWCFAVRDAVMNRAGFGV